MTGRGRGRPREVTADELRTVALDLFEAQGYDATSLTQIAREAGVSRTTLFAHFPTKRDIMWVDHDLRRERLHEVLRAATGEPVSQDLTRALLTVAHYTADEHELLRRRYRIVATSPELRAFSALSTEELAGEIAGWAQARRPQLDPDLVEQVTYALIAVSAKIIDTWALAAAVDQDLEPYLAERLAPFTAALAPLLDTE